MYGWCLVIISHPQAKSFVKKYFYSKLLKYKHLVYLHIHCTDRFNRKPCNYVTTLLYMTADIPVINESSPPPSLLSSSRTSVPLTPSLPSAAGCPRTGPISPVWGGGFFPAVPGAELEVQRSRRTDQFSGLGQSDGPPTGLGRDVQPELQAGHWPSQRAAGQRRGAHLWGGSPGRHQNG